MKPNRDFTKSYYDLVNPMQTFTTVWVLIRPLVYLAEIKRLAYDEDISKDWHVVTPANGSGREESIIHAQDMHHTNQAVYDAITEEISYLERKRGEVDKLLQTQT